tara:strand:+ start:1028 stop:1267 length:240 start_codon:yes stop_codon:yes gene_type:complete
MEAFTHTFLATGCIAAAFYAGRYFTVQSMSEEMTSFIMHQLEEGGFIKTAVDSDGEIELIPITEIIADSIREDRIENSK